MVKLLGNLNDWWDALDDKSRFVWWVLASLVLPVVLYGFGLFGLYALVAFVTGMVRFWKLFLYKP